MAIFDGPAVVSVSSSDETISRDKAPPTTAFVKLHGMVNAVRRFWFEPWAPAADSYLRKVKPGKPRRHRRTR
jgi:hypothetical protein